VLPNLGLSSQCLGALMYLVGQRTAYPCALA
jgi:hypothetical protein